MTNKEINKLMEIQYLKGRLDELYKGFVPHNSTTNNRIVDYRISKYENKLKNIDETAFYLYQVERENIRVSKKKSNQSTVMRCSDDGQPWFLRTVVSVFAATHFCHLRPCDELYGV